jgi:hypothetical protein
MLVLPWAAARSSRSSHSRLNAPSMPMAKPKLFARLALRGASDSLPTREICHGNIPASLGMILATRGDTLPLCPL